MRDLSEDEKVEIKLTPYNDNEMMHLVHVSLYLRKLINEHPVNKSTHLSDETAYVSVPEALYVHMALIYGGSDILDPVEECEEDNEAYIKATKLDSGHMPGHGV